jgi:gamma-glutamylcyclotransferase (GGCT)/AIG2-like uncharacterized protein YtfP
VSLTRHTEINGPYFAYGSNLNVGDMRARCPDARPGVRARLDGWRLIFRCVADIEPALGRTVHGGLWWLSDNDVSNLDAYEGAPSSYRQQMVKVLTEDGLQIAMTYVMTENSYLGLPSSWYFGRIEEGFSHWSLPRSALRRAVDEARASLSKLGVEQVRPDGRKRMRAVLPGGAGFGSGSSET